MLLFWALPIAGIVALLRFAVSGGTARHGRVETPLEVLRRRYAAGKMTKEQFEQWLPRGRRRDGHNQSRVVRRSRLRPRVVLVMVATVAGTTRRRPAGAVALSRRRFLFLGAGVLGVVLAASAVYGLVLPQASTTVVNLGVAAPDVTFTTIGGAVT